MFYALATVLVTDLIQFVLDALGTAESVSKGIVSGFMLDLFADENGADRADTIRTLIPASLMAIALMRGMGSFCGQYFIEVVARNVVHTLRCELFDKLLKTPCAYFDSHASGEIISKITYNTEQVSNAATNALQAGIREGFTVVGLLAFMIYLNWQLCLVFVAVAPFIVLMVVSVNKFFKRYSQRIQASMGSVTEVSREMILGYKIVRLFGGEKYESDRFADVSAYNKKQSLKFTLTKALISPSVQWLMSLSLAALFWLILDPQFAGEMSAGQFASFILAAGQLPKPIRQLTNLIGHIQKGLTACRDIFTVLDSAEEYQGKDYSVDRVKGNVSFENVSFAYAKDGERVLSNINFNVEAGRTIALVGKSGGGKSTLVNLLTRFYRADSGDINIDGINIDDYTLQNLRRHIAFVSQQVTLFNDTVHNNIAYGELNEASRDAVKNAAKMAYALEFIEALPQGFDTVIGDEGLRLSGGQRQRLAIARAILKDAPILILDEATSALDNESEHHIQAAMAEIMQGRTSFVIAHRLSTIESADSILVINEGQIVEQGKHQQLLALEGHYKRLHSRNFQE